MSLAKIIAELVNRGEDDLAEELLATAAGEKPDVRRAEQMGRDAYNKGRISAPAMDPKFMETLKGRQVGDPRTIPELKAWQMGFMDEMRVDTNEKMKKMGII
jgi:hypothetical protein